MTLPLGLRRPPAVVGKVVSGLRFAAHRELLRVTSLFAIGFRRLASLKRECSSVNLKNIFPGVEG